MAKLRTCDRCNATIINKETYFKVYTQYYSGRILKQKQNSDLCVKCWKEIIGEKMNKKSQATIEWLMTYGWAILAVIVVMSSLAIYFYVRSNPDFMNETNTIEYSLNQSCTKECSNFNFSFWKTEYYNFQNFCWCIQNSSEGIMPVYLGRIEGEN